MASNPHYSRITPAIESLAGQALENSRIDPADYTKYDVKRGLRDLNGNGVVAGLTEISEVCSHKMVDGKKTPCEGELFYRGYNVEQLVSGALSEGRYGFEETAYLLMFGQLPTPKQLGEFTRRLSYYRTLPNNFVRDVVLKATSADMMNQLAKCVLTMASYDDKADDISLPNVVRQCIQLTATFPLFAVYSYQAYNYNSGSSLFIHGVKPGQSTAETILSLLRPDEKFSYWEAHILDVCLTLHAEHGGGNNSTFTTHVVTSSGTDTYSCMAAALASLKGPRHGGANIKVIEMFDDLKRQVGDWQDDEEICRYLRDLLHGQAFDKTGLIYGMGHAVYSLSDPRANLLRGFVKTLSKEKGRTEEYDLYSRVERLAPLVIADERKIYKGVSANVDFYSGFIYNMLGLPLELYTPLFAMARVAGWGAHRIEELINMGKIIRPAYVCVAPRREYASIGER